MPISQEKLNSWYSPRWECSTCQDRGEIAAMERVYPGEGHAAMIGSQPCPDCRNLEPDDFSGATEGDR